MTSYTCHNCTKGVGEWCISCRRVDQDDHRIAHAPHIRDDRTPCAPTRNPKSTPLDEDAEDKFRRYIFDLRDLSQMQWVMLHHVWHGGSPSTFGAMFSDLLKHSGLYGDRTRRDEWERTVDELGPKVSRQTASLLWDRSCWRVPVLRHFQTWPVKPWRAQ